MMHLRSIKVRDDISLRRYEHDRHGTIETLSRGSLVVVRPVFGSLKPGKQQQRDVAMSRTQKAKRRRRLGRMRPLAKSPALRLIRNQLWGVTQDGPGMSDPEAHPEAPGAPQSAVASALSHERSLPAFRSTQPSALQLDAALEPGEPFFDLVSQQLLKEMAKWKTSGKPKLKRTFAIAPNRSSRTRFVYS